MQMNVPFVDLSRQFKPLLPEIQAAMNSVIERNAFINGPRSGNLKSTWQNG